MLIVQMESDLSFDWVEIIWLDSICSKARASYLFYNNKSLHAGLHLIALPSSQLCQAQLCLSPDGWMTLFCGLFAGCRHKRTLLSHCMPWPAPGEDRIPGCYGVHNLLSNYDKHVGVTDLMFFKWKKRDNRRNHHHQPHWFNSKCFCGSR